MPFLWERAVGDSDDGAATGNVGVAGGIGNDYDSDECGGWRVGHIQAVLRIGDKTSAGQCNIAACDSKQTGLRIIITADFAHIDIAIGYHISAVLHVLHKIIYSAQCDVPRAKGVIHIQTTAAVFVGGDI